MYETFLNLSLFIIVSLVFLAANVRNFSRMGQAFRWFLSYRGSVPVWSGGLYPLCFNLVLYQVETLIAVEGKFLIT